KKARLQLISSSQEPSIEVALTELSPIQVFQLFSPLLFTGLAFLLIGALAFFIQPSPPGVGPFVGYCLTAGSYLLTGYDFHTTYQLSELLLAAFALIPATVV